MRQTFTQWGLTALILAAGLWQTAQAASPFAREVPTTYARFEKGAGSLTVVVAELVSTDYLKGYDCPKPKTNADGSAGDGSADDELATGQWNAHGCLW